MGIFFKKLSVNLFFCLKNIWKLFAGFFNRIQKDIFSDFLALFLQNKLATVKEKVFRVVFYSIAAGVCDDSIKIYISHAKSCKP